MRRFGRMFIVGARLTVPFGMIILRKGYGLGAMAMAGGSFHAPQFTVAWPTGEIGGMGLEGAVRLGFSKELAAAADEVERQRSSTSWSPPPMSTAKRYARPPRSSWTTSSTRPTPADGSSGCPGSRAHLTHGDRATRDGCGCLPGLGGVDVLVEVEEVVRVVASFEFDEPLVVDAVGVPDPLASSAGR